MAYADLLRGASLNLVSRRDLDLLGQRHLPESRAFAQALPGAEPLVDIGSGGGLPGLVCAIWQPDRRVLLVESRSRKATWLVRAAEQLHLGNVEVVHGRAEDLTGVGGAVVTARAVAPLPRLLTYAEPVMAPGATLHAIKGRRWAEELTACGDLEQLGWDVVGTPSGAAAGYVAAPVGADDPHPQVVILRWRG